MHLVQEGWQEQPHASVPRLPLGVEHVIRRPHPCAQCPEGLGQGGAGDTRDHVVAQHGVRESGIEERRAGVRQREGKRIEILTAAQPGFPIRFFGGTKDVASQSVEDIERVILCGGFERVDERDHRGGSASRWQPCDRGDVGFLRKARQGGHSRRRDRGGRWHGDAEATDGVQPLERTHQRRATHHRGTRPQRHE